MASAAALNPAPATAPPASPPRRLRRQIPVVQRSAVITLKFTGHNWTRIAELCQINADTAKGIWKTVNARAADSSQLVELLAVVEPLPRFGRPRMSRA